MEEGKLRWVRPAFLNGLRKHRRLSFPLEFVALVT
jgi:hypothetical protein